MKKNCILIVLICVSLPLQSTWKHKIRKYGIYLGCATVGCLVTLFATQHKKTRPYFKNFLFPNYVQAHGDLVNEVGTLNQQLGNTTQDLQDSTTQLQGIRSQLEASQQTNLALSNNYNTLSTDHATLRFQHTAQQNELDALKAKITNEYHPLIKGFAWQANTTQKLCKSEAELSKLYQENQESDLNTSLNCIKTLLAQAKQKDTLLQTLQSQMNTMETQLDNLDGPLETENADRNNQETQALFAQIDQLG